MNDEETPDSDEPCPECGIKPVRSRDGKRILIRCGGHLIIPVEVPPRE